MQTFFLHQLYQDVYKRQYQQRYAFSGKIICNECGDTFRRRMHSSTYGKYVAWCCNTHLADKDKCSMLYLRDDDLKVAFITVLNKLIYSHKLVLKPYAAALQNNSGDENFIRIQHLERLLEQNTDCLLYTSVPFMIPTLKRRS